MFWFLLVLFLVSNLGTGKEHQREVKFQAGGSGRIILVDEHMEDIQEKLRNNKQKILQEVNITLDEMNSVEFLSALKCDRINILTLTARNRSTPTGSEDKQTQILSQFRWSTRIDVLDIAQVSFSNGIPTLVENTTELLIMSFRSFVDLVNIHNTSLNAREVLLTGVNTSTLVVALNGSLAALSGSLAALNGRPGAQYDTRRIKKKNRTVRRATLYVDEDINSLHDRGTGEMVQKISRWVVDEFENLEVLNIEHWMFREPNTLRKGFCFDFTGIPGLRILSVNELILYLDRTVYEARATSLLLAGRSKIVSFQNLIDIPSTDQIQCSEAIIPTEKIGQNKQEQHSHSYDDTNWLLLGKKMAINEAACS